MIPPAPQYNANPFSKRRQYADAKTPLTRPEEQLRRDLRALEAVQASRPAKPPGKR
jgi:hypothetical protein